MKYVFKKSDAQQFNKHGVDISVYGENYPPINVAKVSIKEGCFEEFYNSRSSFTYYVISGRGVFVLNDEQLPVNEGDLIVVPPNTRIHYFGSMEMTLSVVPAFNEVDERHVRFVDPSENPLL